MSDLKINIKADLEATQYLINDLKRQWKYSDILEVEKQVNLKIQLPEISLLPLDQETARVINRFRDDEIAKITKPRLK